MVLFELLLSALPPADRLSRGTGLVVLGFNVTPRIVLMP